MMFKDKISSIQLRNIRKSHAPAGFTLDINDAEFDNRALSVIVGANGSGKSTLLKLIAFLDRPDEGNILFNNRNISLNGSGDGWLRKRIGFIMQKPYLFSTTVFKNIAMGLKIRKCPRHEILFRVERILSILKMGHLAQRRVEHLSGGEYKKAAIAQVLVFRPEIILIDEPMAHVDTGSILAIEETIKQIREEFSPVIIMTTHSPEQACRMSPKIISLRGGKLVDNLVEAV
jgi:tungstate transport system ATP-binding protein